MHYRDRLYLYCKVAHLGRLELTTSRRRASTLPLSCRKPKLKVAQGIIIQASRAMQTGHLATKFYPIFVEKFKKVVFLSRQILYAAFFPQDMSRKLHCTSFASDKICSTKRTIITKVWLAGLIVSHSVFKLGTKVHEKELCLLYFFFFVLTPW